MLKKLIAGIFFAVLYAGVLCISSSALDVIIDGEKVQFNDSYGYPFISGENRTLVPLRVTMEAYGAQVRWDEESRIASVILDETTVHCPINCNYIYRNGTKIPNEVGAVIIDGRTYLPIRAVLEAFDAKVDYDGNVLVTSPADKVLVKNFESAKPGNKKYWKQWESAMALFNSGKYSEAASAFTVLIPTILKYDKPVNVAMLYNHLGFCYENMGNGDFAAACFKREAELWDMDGDHQSAIAAERKAKYSSTVVQMFATTANKKFNVRLFTDNEFVPASGIITGVTLKGSSYGYLESFRQSTGKQLSGGLIYARPEQGINEYMTILTSAARDNTVIQIGLQPYDINEIRSITENDSRYVKIAQDINSSGAKVLIRFACEMNDTGSLIFTQDYELYKQKFRLVADIFHRYAPNCAMVWSPNFYPEDTMELYYPGDAYVDFVGISAYAEHAPETDPLEAGIDRSRFAALLDRIVSLYGCKKPMIVSECGSSYRDVKTGVDITGFASRQINEFLTYLPIKYPQISYAFLFETVDAAGIRKFELDKNPVYKDAVVSAMKQDVYLTSANGTSGSFSFELGNNVRVPAEKVQLHSFVQTLHNDFSYIVYRINGVDVGVSYGIPYTVEFDFSGYAGNTVELTCLAFDSEQKLCAQRTVSVKVE